MERMAIGYLANALWQLPVLAAGAWLLLRIWKPEAAAQHWVWLAVLGLGLVLPLGGAVGASAAESPVAGAELRPASLSHADGQIDTPHRAQEDSGAGLSSADFAETAGSGPSIAALNYARGSHASREQWSTRPLSAFVQRVSVSAALARWTVGIWLAVMLVGLLRLAGAWRAARRLVADSREVELHDRERTALLQCARRLGVAAPVVRESDGIAGPVVVGAFAPVLLWPESFRRCSEDELRAALCHELAHVRRRDYGMNLVCEAAAAPLKWHPAARGVERRIRATREMACDAMAAEAMESETVYAECLVRLARSIVGAGMAEGSVAAGLLNGNVMEERVMRLMRGRTTMSWRAKVARGVAGAAAMMAAVALAGMFHVVPAMAQARQPLAAPVQSANVQPAVRSTTPQSQASPAPAATAKAHARSEKHGAGKPIVIVNGQERELTAAERARVEKQLAEAQKRIAEATAKFNSPEFRAQIEEAQRKAMEAETKLNSPEFKRQIAEAQKQANQALARVNSPEFQREMKEAAQAAAKVNTPEFRKQIAEAQKQATEAVARVNSPEFKRQIEEAARAAAKVNSAEFQKQMADAQKQVADALAKMKAEQEKGRAK